MGRKGRDENDLSEGQLHYVEKLCAEHQNKLVYAKWVDYKIKSKVSRRILVIASYVVFVIKQSRKLTKKKRTFPGNLRLKIRKRYDLLALRSISVFKNNTKQLELQFYKKTPLTVLTPLVSECIREIRTAIRLFTYGFPNGSLPGLFGMDGDMLLPLEPCALSDFGPANGFLNTFSAFCCFYKQKISNEVMRYVTDLHEAGIVEFRLQDCPGIEPKGELPFSIEPIAAALRYNTYFKAISAVHLQKKDILFSLCSILRYNTKITKIRLSHLNEGNITELAEALQYNRNNALQIIDLSGTHITKGVSLFCYTLQTFPHSLKVLNLSSCSLEGKQIAAVVDTLKQNYGMSLTIEELDLSDNKFDEQASIAFETWLSKAAEYSCLQSLSLANTGQNLGTVAAYFHFLKDLEELNLSNSKFDTRSVQLLCSTLEKSRSLRILDLSHSNLSNGFASSIIEAFLGNKSLSKTKLNLSACELTESDAEQVTKGLSLTSNCHTLNLSRNRFKELGLIGILQAVVLSTTLTLDTLVLDNVYKHTYPGERVSSALMSVSNSLASVKSISIAGGFSTVVIPFLGYVVSSTTLLELDISNNYIGDSAASAISDLLRRNNCLLRLKCDGNNISPSGWKMILASFVHNHTLMEMDFPWKDYQRYSSLSASKLEEFRAILIDIQRALQTNHSDDVSRLRPPPSRPLPSFVHPSADLPGKLTLTKNLGLSSLDSSKISVGERAEDDPTPPPPTCMLEYDLAFDSSTEESEMEDELIVGSQGGTVAQWFTDSESFDEFSDSHLSSGEHTLVDSLKPKRKSITLANLTHGRSNSQSLSGSLPAVDEDPSEDYELGVPAVFDISESPPKRTLASLSNSSGSSNSVYREKKENYSQNSPGNSSSTTTSFLVEEKKESPSEPQEEVIEDESTMMSSDSEFDI